jgi:phage terminase small subunit
MPRRSIAQLTTPQIHANGATIHIAPPNNLNKTEQDLFKQIVRSLEPKHFATSDAPLLARYVKNLILADVVGKNLEREGLVTDAGKPSPWLRVQEKLDHTIVTLSSKLRLCPQSRIGPRDAHRRAANAQPMSFYEQMRMDQREQEQEEADA